MSQYAKIVLPETNRCFLSLGEDVEWDYEIVNPVKGSELTVAAAPDWCGGPDGVEVGDGKIRFSVAPSSESIIGKFVFTYKYAQNAEVDVRLARDVASGMTRNL